MSEEEVTAAAQTNADGDHEDGGAGEGDVVREEESTATFEPLVRLEEVETRSGEEDEEVLYLKRAKLFIYGETLLDKGTGNKTWRERGIGEVRLMRHREHGKIRLLMRQEKTMKVISNHFVDPRIVLQPNVGSDRSWVWSAFDFSEGELKETVFAIRFSDSEIADDFKKRFETCQKEMDALLSGQDRPGADGGAAGDEAAAALAGLSTQEAPASEETTAAEAPSAPATEEEKTVTSSGETPSE